MIDIHPPHKSDHTWKDFFIHIGTIAVGILIAIGLEQTVEPFTSTISAPSCARAPSPTRGSTFAMLIKTGRQYQQVEDLTARIGRFGRQSRSITCWLRSVSPVFPIETIRLGNLDAAISSGLIHLLSKDEINSTGDAEVAVIKSEA